MPQLCGFPSFTGRKPHSTQSWLEQLTQESRQSLEMSSVWKWARRIPMSTVLLAMLAGDFGVSWSQNCNFPILCVQCSSTGCYSLCSFCWPQNVWNGEAPETVPVRTVITGSFPVQTVLGSVQLLFCYQLKSVRHLQLLLMNCNLGSAKHNLHIQPSSL